MTIDQLREHMAWHKKQAAKHHSAIALLNRQIKQIQRGKTKTVELLLQRSGIQPIEMEQITDNS
ncbi:MULTISPECIES: hypothetical protein [Methylomicrobium]|uniref:hypothetical protein n=1 Tax=Methylomicrobium TaxID=39773 RepID=UPI0002623E0B|nr:MULTISPECIES: hypothetical protein [Methylomicrobium]